MYKKEELYLTTRNSIFYFVRRVPRDLIQYYSSNRISLSLKTKSKLKALRVSSTVKQKLDDYWLGLRLQKLDIPQILIAKDKVNSQRDRCKGMWNVMRNINVTLVSSKKFIRVSHV